MGRKPKLTTELQDKICTAIAAGNYNIIAAQYAGIGERTFYRWMEEERTPPLAPADSFGRL